MYAFCPSPKETLFPPSDIADLKKKKPEQGVPLNGRM